MSIEESSFPFFSQFVIAWWRANSFQELCKQMAKLGLDRREVSNLAAALRRHAIRMKNCNEQQPSRKRKRKTLTFKEILKLRELADEEFCLYSEKVEKIRVQAENKKTLKDIKRLRDKEKLHDRNS